MMLPRMLPVAVLALAVLRQPPQTVAQLQPRTAPYPAAAQPSAHNVNTLTNSALSATISAGRLVALSDSHTKTRVAVAGDDFSIQLDGAPVTARTTVLSSANFRGQPTLQPGANGSSLAVRWGFEELVVEVRYSLVSSAARLALVLFCVFLK